MITVKKMDLSLHFFCVFLCILLLELVSFSQFEDLFYKAVNLTTKRQHHFSLTFRENPGTVKFYTNIVARTKPGGWRAKC